MGGRGTYAIGNQIVVFLLICIMLWQKDTILQAG